jgi:hypothetical protein
MERDKTRDSKYFNCLHEYEIDYIAGLYENRQQVYDFIKAACAKQLIKNAIHFDVYMLVKEELGYNIPA